MDTLPSQASNAEQADGILGGQLTLEAAAIVRLEAALARQGDRRSRPGLHTEAPGTGHQAGQQVLAGVSAEPGEKLKLAKRLAGDTKIGLARRVLKSARQDLTRSDDELYAGVFQKSALYTYKDPDLPVDWRLDRAFEILEEGVNLATANGPRMAGAGRRHLQAQVGGRLRPPASRARVVLLPPRLRPRRPG